MKAQENEQELLCFCFILARSQKICEYVRLFTRMPGRNVIFSTTMAILVNQLTSRFHVRYGTNLNQHHFFPYSILGWALASSITPSFTSLNHNSIWVLSYILQPFPGPSLSSDTHNLPFEKLAVKYPFLNPQHGRNQ